MASPEPRRVAVVLFNLGGPDSLAAVRPFLFNLFRDPAIIGLPGPARLGVAALISSLRARSAKANYAHIGGASPLLEETAVQASALEDELRRRSADWAFRLFIAMRYWRPFTEEAARAVEQYRPDEVVLLPLYPQYSTTTTASSLKAWSRAYRGPGELRAVCCYPDERGWIAAQAERIARTFEAAGRPGPIRLLLSAHGLPERVVAAGDPYRWQVERTCAAIAERLGSSWDWRICYQSRVGPLKWLGPSTPEAIEQAVGEGLGVLVAPVAFVSEHVETLVELDRDYRELADRLGCPIYLRAPAVGVHPAFIAGLADTVMRALERPAGVESGCGGRLCGAEWPKCPAREAA